MQESDDTKDIIRKFDVLMNELTYDQLVILNRMAVDRIRFMQKAGALMYMSKFNVGDTVYFMGNDGAERSGIIIRLNQKTASIKTKDHGQWNVSPHLLRK